MRPSTEDKMKRRMYYHFSGFMLLAILLLWATANPASAEAGKQGPTFTSWASLQAAINDAGSGDTIRLTGDLTAGISDTSLVIPEGKSLILDLAGSSLDRGLKALDTEQGSVIRVSSGAMLTIRDSGENRGVITGGYALNGGGIYNGGTLILEGGSVTGNTCEGLGGGVYNAYTLIIQGGTVTGNTALENAGGVFSYRSARLTSGSGAIFGNSAPEGMNMDIDSDGTMSIIGGQTGEPAALNEYLEMLSMLPPLALLLALLFAVGIDAYLSREQKKLMVVIVVVAFGLLIQDYLGYRMSFFEKRPELRTFNAIAGYALRPIILALFLRLVQPGRRFRAVWALVGVNAAIYLTALFCPLAFYFKINNRFVTGPLHQTCTVVSALLLGCLLWQTLRVFRLKEKRENWIPVFITALIVGSVWLDFEVSFNDRPLSFLNIAIVICCVFYYVWLHLQFVREHEQALQAEQRIRIMISQIQPHFLYNTLSTIQALCDTDPATAKRTVEQFGLYLRQNIASLSQESLITLEQELAHTRIYVDIERLRFENIEVHYDIQAEDFAVPALTLQPLVENAIRHGVRNREQGVVSIASRRRDGLYEIVVRDNGQGFDADRIDRMNQSHIGIRNVRERIERMCGGTVTVESVIGEGTTATIQIPVKERQADKETR